MALARSKPIFSIFQLQAHKLNYCCGAGDNAGLAGSSSGGSIHDKGGCGNIYMSMSIIVTPSKSRMKKTTDWPSNTAVSM
jgi:hypothetical protein